MSKRATHREIPEAHRASEHLDNERTFLAWVRTNVALISFGFVVARLTPTLGTAGAAKWQSHRFESGRGGNSADNPGRRDNRDGRLAISSSEPSD